MMTQREASMQSLYAVLMEIRRTMDRITVAELSLYILPLDMEEHRAINHMRRSYQQLIQNVAVIKTLAYVLEGMMIMPEMRCQEFYERIEHELRCAIRGNPCQLFASDHPLDKVIEKTICGRGLLPEKYQPLPVERPKTPAELEPKPSAPSPATEEAPRISPKTAKTKNPRKK